MQKGYVSQRRSRGLCTHCTNEALPGLSYCLKCWFGNTAANHFVKRRFSKYLEEIWERQKGRCAYTGEKLTPGVNASLDHIQHVRNGWTNHKARKTAVLEKNILTSVQWVTKTTNKAKCHMNHTEFIRFCKKIAARF